MTTKLSLGSQVGGSSGRRAPRCMTGRNGPIVDWGGSADQMLRCADPSADGLRMTTKGGLSCRMSCHPRRLVILSAARGEGALARPRTPRHGWRGRGATHGCMVSMARSSCACRPPDPSGFALRMTSREGCGFAAQGVTGAATTRRLPSPGAGSVDDDTCHGNLFRDAGSMLRTPADLKPARPLRGRGGECTSGITAPGLRVRQRRGRNESAVSSTRPREVP